MTTKSERIPSEDIEGLIWAMLDDQISADDFQRLDDLLRADEGARQLYLQCVQLHVDLKYWFDPEFDPARRKPAGLPIDIPLPLGDATMADPAF